MNISELKRKAEAAISNSGIPIDDRLEEVLALADQFGDNNPAQKLNGEIVCYALMIKMIREENAYSTHITLLMQLFTLLAEDYAKLQDYRPLNDLAFDVREVLRDERIAWDALEDTLPRIIEAMEETVFHYETYRLLLVYIHTAFVNGELDSEMKGYIRHFLKLRLLLKDSSWSSHWINADLKATISSLFTSEELLKIILNPAVGHLKEDPIEYTPEWEEIYYDVEDELKRRFENAPRHMGFCFRYWSAKQDLLKEKYNIDWRTPSQMNPGVRFD